MSEFGIIGGDFLKMDFRDFSKLALFFEQFPREARVATAQFLNDMGFLAKANAPVVLGGKMHIRNQRFVGSRIRVEKTTAKPIDQQRVTVGSVPGDRFTGWIEQQRGTSPERGRVFSLLARGGDEQQKAKPGARLKQDNEFDNVSDWDDMNAPTKSRMLQFLAREMAEGVYKPKRSNRHRSIDKRPFVVGKGYGVRPGLYTVKTRGGYKLPSTGRMAAKLQMIQGFDKQPRPKRWPWIQDVVHYTIKSAPIGKMWTSAMSRAWERMHARMRA
jgi:hypothetical protein